MNKKLLHIGIVTIILVVWIWFILSLGAKGDDGIKDLNDNITQAEIVLVEKKNVYDVEYQEYIDALSWLNETREYLSSLYDKKKQMLSGFISGATTP